MNEVTGRDTETAPAVRKRRRRHRRRRGGRKALVAIALVALITLFMLAFIFNEILSSLDF
jgi:hypothetical protein